MDSTALYDTLCRGNFIIAGPCVLESLATALDCANVLAEAAAATGLTAIFKSSWDKANRTSLDSYRGVGLEQGLEWLLKIKQATGLPVLTDIHLPEQAAPVAEVVEVLQIPALLSRQTDLLVAAARTGAIVNVKKGQFMAPWDLKEVKRKIENSGNHKIFLTERGSTFGYNNLVVDMRSIPIMQELDVPVVFDATHSVQLPGAHGNKSGGQRQFIPVLARAAVAAGANGLFMEVHPDPLRALCDGANSWPLDKLTALLKELNAIWRITHVC